MSKKVAILGGGNIGMAIARGLVACGKNTPAEIVVTRRSHDALQDIAAEGFETHPRSEPALRSAGLVVLCVQPSRVRDLCRELRPHLDAERHSLISVVTGVSSGELAEASGGQVPIVRAMPNTAIVIGESMTCLSAAPEHAEALASARELFEALGQTLVIEEDQMTQATALCACGIAFFLRAIRAASQGGIEIGFHAGEALFMAAQTARGAASLLIGNGGHPESEIDRVTTPMGCTIAGLNRMEHEGFSSALIRGIVTSSDKAGTLGRESETGPPTE